MKLSELGALCKPGPFSISVPSDLYTIENLLCIVSHVGGMGGRNFSFFLNEPYFICLPYSALLLGLLDVVHICGAGENVSMAYSSRVGGHRLHLYGCH